MAWERLKSTDVANGKNIGSHRHVVKRVYSEGGYREWPRITLGIFEKGDTINIGISRKIKADGSWENVSLPRELTGELAEMLGEYAKIKTTKKKVNYLAGAC